MISGVVLRLPRAGKASGERGELMVAEDVQAAEAVGGQLRQHRGEALGHRQVPAYVYCSRKDESK